MKQNDSNLDRPGATRAEFFKNIAEKTHNTDRNHQVDPLQNTSELPPTHALQPAKEVALLLDHLSIAREESKEALSLARETIEYIKETSKEASHLKDIKIENLEMKIEKKDNLIIELQEKTETTSQKIKELESMIEKLKKENEDLETLIEF